MSFTGGSPSRFNSQGLYQALERSPSKTSTSRLAFSGPGIDDIVGSSRLFPGAPSSSSLASSSFPTSRVSHTGHGGGAAIVANVFPPSYNYFVGVWRRTPYDVVRSEPTALNGARGGAHVHSFDTDVGQVWRIHASQVHANGFYLEALEVGEARFLADDLGMVADREDAALWLFEFTDPFRGGRNDVAVKIFNETGLLLCSEPINGRVILMSDKEAGTREQSGDWVYNNAWEITPDVDDVEVDAFLEKYLQQQDDLDKFIADL